MWYCEHFVDAGFFGRRSCKNIHDVDNSCLVDCDTMLPYKRLCPQQIRVTPYFFYQPKDGVLLNIS